MLTNERLRHTYVRSCAKSAGKIHITTTIIYKLLCIICIRLILQSIWVHYYQIQDTYNCVVVGTNIILLRLKPVFETF